MQTGGRVSGGGSSQPEIISSGSCILIGNVAPLNTFNFKFGNESFKATDNFITPNTTGATLNGKSYTFEVAKPENISNGVYMVLTGISYLPIQHTAGFKACQTNSTPSINTISVNANFGASGFKVLSVMPPGFTNSVKLESTSSGPVVPNGYNGIFIANISVNAISVKTVNFTINYLCSISADVIHPFVLNNGAWQAIRPYGVNSVACTANFGMPKDSTFALLSAIIATTPQQKPSNTPPSTTIEQKTTTKTSSASYINFLYIIAAIAAIAAIIGGALYKGGKDKKGKESNTTDQPAPTPPPEPTKPTTGKQSKSGKGPTSGKSAAIGENASVQPDNSAALIMMPVTEMNDVVRETIIPPAVPDVQGFGMTQKIEEPEHLQESVLTLEK